jgi:hypothetical protein
MQAWKERLAQGAIIAGAPYLHRPPLLAALHGASLAPSKHPKSDPNPDPTSESHPSTTTRPPPGSPSGVALHDFYTHSHYDWETGYLRVFSHEPGPSIAGGSGLYGGWGDAAFVGGVKEAVDEAVAEWGGGLGITNEMHSRSWYWMADTHN